MPTKNSSQQYSLEGGCGALRKYCLEIQNCSQNNKKYELHLPGSNTSFDDKELILAPESEGEVEGTRHPSHTSRVLAGKKYISKLHVQVKK